MKPQSTSVRPLLIAALAGVVFAAPRPRRHDGPAQGAGAFSMWAASAAVAGTQVLPS